MLHNEFKWKRVQKRDRKKKHNKPKLLILAPIHFRAFVFVSIYLISVNGAICKIHENQTKSRIEIYLLWLYLIDVK